LKGRFAPCLQQMLAEHFWRGQTSYPQLWLLTGPFSSYNYQNVFAVRRLVLP